MSTVVSMGVDVLDRMVRAVLKIRERLLRAAALLNGAGIPYAVIGGHAVASWVARADAGAVRNTRDIELLVRRADLPAVTAALAQGGLVQVEGMGVTTFLEGPDAKPSESIHPLFANEMVRQSDALPSPDVATINDPGGYPVIQLDALVVMKLLSYRDKDRTHLGDLIEGGLVDRTWVPRLPREVAGRLEQLLDTPES